MGYTIEQYQAELAKLENPETMGEATLTIATMLKADKDEELETTTKLNETTTRLSDTQAQLLENQKQLFILGVGNNEPNKPKEETPPTLSPKELVNAMFGKKE